MQTSRLVIFFTALICLLSSEVVYAQFYEPQPDTPKKPKDNYTQNVRNGASLDIFVTNFGLAIGGTYRRVVGPMSEIYFSAQISGLRNVDELSYNFLGQQIIPNKYNRAIVFPLLLGMRTRLFPSSISDNMRLYLNASAGPAFAMLYPYYRDINENGFRDSQAVLTQSGDYIDPERINDFFSGWDDSYFKTGLSAEFFISADFGERFRKLSGVQFGVQMYYFGSGLQIMEPYRPIDLNQYYNEGINLIKLEQGSEQFLEYYQKQYDTQKFFITPRISLYFGRMW